MNARRVLRSARHRRLPAQLFADDGLNTLSGLVMRTLLSSSYNCPTTKGAAAAAAEFWHRKETDVQGYGCPAVNRGSRCAGVVVDVYG